MDGVFSIATYYDLLERADEWRSPAVSNPLLSPQSFGGVRIEQSAVFPMQLECAACGGTGEGEASTYCPKCKGAGENRYEGMMRNGAQTILLTVPLPKAFQPYFPASLVPVPPLARGLP